VTAPPSTAAESSRAVPGIRPFVVQEIVSAQRESEPKNGRSAGATLRGLLRVFEDPAVRLHLDRLERLVVGIATASTAAGPRPPRRLRTRAIRVEAAGASLSDARVEDDAIGSDVVRIDVPFVDASDLERGVLRVGDLPVGTVIEADPQPIAVGVVGLSRIAREGKEDS
jgi:hypothetical protein